MQERRLGFRNTGRKALYRMVSCNSAPAQLNAQFLPELRLHSRRRNQARATTGLLLVSGNDLLQAVEGEQHAVQHLYDIIAWAIRHPHTCELADGPITERALPAWFMDFATATPKKFAQLAGYHNLSGTGFVAVRPQRLDHSVFEVLRQFAAAHTANP
jgi:hypothetical protein